jgi:hypothetical protein
MHGSSYPFDHIIDVGEVPLHLAEVVDVNWLI